jgi:diguanylate cyclase (GGDEF)-like protein
VVRYGGEEITIVAPNTAAPVAGMLAERLCRTVEHTVLVPAGNSTNQEDVRLTISIGVATLQGASDDPRKLTGRADAALYEAKRDGRNRVVVSRTERAEREEQNRG